MWPLSLCLFSLSLPHFTVFFSHICDSWTGQALPHFWVLPMLFQPAALLIPTYGSY